jgi:hypothetical protein
MLGRTPEGNPPGVSFDDVAVANRVDLQTQPLRNA